MTITELIPTVKELPHADKLLLLQILVQELIKAEGINNNQPSNSLYEPTEPTLTSETPAVSEQPDAPLTEDGEDSLALEERYAFIRQPLAERRRILAEQAEAMQIHYEQNTEWKELMTGDRE